MDIKTVIDLEKQRKRLKKSRKLWKILSYLVAFVVFGPMLALALIIIFLDFPKLDLGIESLSFFGHVYFSNNRHAGRILRVDF